MTLPVKIYGELENIFLQIEINVAEALHGYRQNIYKVFAHILHNVCTHWLKISAKTQKNKRDSW